VNDFDESPNRPDQARLNPTASCTTRIRTEHEQEYISDGIYFYFPICTATAPCSRVRGNVLLLQVRATKHLLDASREN